MYDVNKVRFTKYEVPFLCKVFDVRCAMQQVRSLKYEVPLCKVFDVGFTMYSCKLAIYA